MLFADVTGSTRLYEAAGDRRAVEAIGRCIDMLRQASEACGGRVVKTMGDELMALFPTPDAAADAATRMQYAVEALPPIGEQKLALRIAFHCGPVVQRDNDVFGDTVNLASRLVEQATKGQVLTSAHTAALLAPLLHSWTRRLYAITIKGKLEEVALCELLWRQSPDITDAGLAPVAPRPASVRLRLVYKGRTLIRRRREESISIGRDPSCELVIVDSKASRQHCLIYRRQDKFILRDHSTNGTYVTVNEESEVLLRREEFTLRAHGTIAFGQPRGEALDVVEFFCE